MGVDCEVDLRQERDDLGGQGATNAQGDVACHIETCTGVCRRAANTVNVDGVVRTTGHFFLEGSVDQVPPDEVRKERVSGVSRPNFRNKGIGSG